MDAKAGDIQPTDNTYMFPTMPRSPAKTFGYIKATLPNNALFTYPAGCCCMRTSSWGPRRIPSLPSRRCTARPLLRTAATAQAARASASAWTRKASWTTCWRCSGGTMRAGSPAPPLLLSTLVT